MGYTLAQFHGYLDRAQKRERREHRERIEAAALGAIGGEPLQTALKDLQD